MSTRVKVRSWDEIEAELSQLRAERDRLKEVYDRLNEVYLEGAKLPRSTGASIAAMARAAGTDPQHIRNVINGKNAKVAKKSGRKG